MKQPHLAQQTNKPLEPKDMPTAQQNNNKNPNKFIENRKPFSIITLNMNGFNLELKDVD